MCKKKYIPAPNCQFHLGKGGKLTIKPAPEFRQRDYIKTLKMIKEHAKRKKLGQPKSINKWWNEIYWLNPPTLTEVA